MVRKKTKAYVLKDGSVISKGTLDKYSIKQESKQIPEPTWSQGEYSKLSIVEPPYSLENLIQLPEINTWHYRACDTKARDVIGAGWDLEPEKDDPSDEERERFERFIERCGKSGKTFVDLIYASIFDYETTGNQAIEYVRGEANQGESDFLAHIQAHTVRRMRDKVIKTLENGEKVRGKDIFVQKRGQKKVYFKAIGAPFDINHKTGEVHPLNFLSVENRGNEIIWNTNYTPKSDYYGLPDVMPALISILGDRESQKYNVEFFENYAVPAYAVTITGASLDEKTEKKIQDFFQRDLKDNRHSTLVLTEEGEQDTVEGTPDEVKFNFEKLAVDVRESSFRLYRQDNRTEVLSANGVPSYRASVAITGDLGGNVAEQADQIYDDMVVKPRKIMVEDFINRYVMEALEIESWKFKFEPMLKEDVYSNDERLFKYFEKGAITPNQLREKGLGLESVEDPGMDSYYLGDRPIGGPLADQQEQEGTGVAERRQVAKALSQLRKDLMRVIKGE